MIWLQALPAFLIWVAFVFLRRRWLLALPAKLRKMRRAGRIAAMLVALFGSLALLYGGILGIERLGWLSEDGLSPIGTLAVLIVGLLFLHLQMVSFALTLSLIETTVTKQDGELSNTASSKLSNGEEK